ncbi:MAG: HTH-type transcriptional regulator Ptr1 [Methanocella sp. PtaU1.Bin125]|nr:MAG: HTH-type transcriptional regulator Ptr1 [Methanocella sp. PtaU1.Bin125]
MDSLDFRILGMLIRDSRVSYETIAAALDVPAETAINRIFRMWDVGVISEYRIKVNPSLFGYKTAIVLAEAYRNYCKQKDIRAIRTMDRVTAVVETTSKIYSAYVLHTGEQELKGLVDQIKAKITPSRVTNVVFPREAPPSVKLSGQDWRIIEHLMDDPRASVDNMACDLQIAPKTLERRMEKLISGGVMAPTVVIQPGMFEGMFSNRLYIIFNDGSERARTGIVDGIKNKWNVIGLEHPQGAIIDVYGKTRRDIEDDLRSLKSMPEVRETFYTLPSRIVSSDLLIRKKVIEAVYRSDSTAGL